LLDSFRRSIFFKPWRNQAKAFRQYFAIYGGWRALFSSPYLHASIVIGLLLDWLTNPAPDFGAAGINILPNVLGFTIGGMAIVLAVGSSKIFVRLAEHGEPKSFFMRLISNFLHYILLQVVTLLFCLSSSGPKLTPNINTICSVLLTYSLLSVLSIGVGLFQMGQIHNADASLPEKKTDKGNEG
jgi:hypothetical protein